MTAASFNAGRVLLCALLGFLGLLAACARGPAEDTLPTALQARLDDRFQPGLFAVRRFKRNGSAPFQDLQGGVSGVYVYYTAELEFRQDYDLAEWNGLNLGTLAFAIGATEEGIDGFRAAGNRRGDVLTVRGRFSYQDAGGGQWVSLDRQPVSGRRRHEDQVQDTEGPSAKSVVADARELVAQEGQVQAGTRGAIILEELGIALERIDLRTARLEHAITIGTGPKGGTYHGFGQAFSRYAQRQGDTVYSARSEGSVENASQLQSGRLDFGIVQSDVAQMLYQGWRREGFFRNLNLRAVASLWPEAMHLVTLESSGIRSIADLPKRRIGIGQRGSGSRVNALLVGRMLEFDDDQRPMIRELGLARAIRELEAGDLDAFFLTEAVPAPAIQALATRRQDLRFVSIPLSLLDGADDLHLDYFPLTVAARTYPGQVEPFTTLGMTAALLTSANVSDQRVERVLELLATGGDELARYDYRAAFISRKTMRLGLAVPLHPAAARFFERTGPLPAAPGPVPITQ